MARLLSPRQSDLKALVDTAANALKLVEVLPAHQANMNTREEVAREMARILDPVDARRRKYVEEPLATIEELKSGQSDETPQPVVTDLGAEERLEEIAVAEVAPGKEKPPPSSARAARQSG